MLLVFGFKNLSFMLIWINRLKLFNKDKKISKKKLIKKMKEKEKEKKVIL